MKTLVDRIYRINNTWLGFYQDVKKLKKNKTQRIFKNCFPTLDIDKHINSYLNKTFKEQKQQESSNGLATKCFKLPFIGEFWNIAQNRVNNLAKRFCRDIEIRLVYSTYKNRSMLNAVKDPVPKELRSNVVCKFTCAFRHTRS